MKKCRIKLKTILFFIIALGSSHQAISQEVIEKIHTLNKKYNDFWTGKKSNMLIEFQKVYFLESNDTVYRTIINVNNKEYEVVGTSSSINLFSVGNSFIGAGGATTEKKIIKQKGSYILNRENIENISDGINKIYSTLKQWQFQNFGNDRLLTYYINEDIRIAGDYTPNALINKISYLFQFEDILFTLNEEDFVEISKLFKKIRDTWIKLVPKT